MLRPKSVIFIAGTALVFGMVFVFPAQASEGFFLKAKNIAINGWGRVKENASFMFGETKRSLGKIIYKDEGEQDSLPIKVYESNQQTSSILDQLRNFLGVLKKKTSEVIVIISKPEKQEPTGPMMSAKTSQVVQPTLRDQVKIIVQETRTTTIDNSKIDSFLQDFNKYKEAQQKFISELAQVSNVGPRGNVAYTIGNPTFTGTAQGLGDDDIPDDITVSSSKSLSATTISVGTLTNVRIAGSSQFSTITAALDDLPSTGGTIFIPPNTTLSVSATITINKPNVKILGGGRSSIVRASSGTFNVFTVSADDVVFENFAIEGGATANTTTQYGIFTAAASPALRGRVQNVYFTGADSSTGLNNGMVLDTASNSWKISNNTFDRLIGAISGTGYGVLLGTSHLHSITNNHFTGATGQGRHAIYVSAGSTYNVVADNIIDAFNESSIVIYSTAAQASGQFNNIARNTIRNQALGSTGTAAIEVTGDSSYNLIADNVIVSTGRHGIAFIDGGNSGLNTDNTARGNKIYQPGQIGVIVEGASRTEIVANSIFNASNSDSGVYSGISIAQGSTFVADQTKIENNIIYGTTHRNAIGLDTTSPTPTDTRIVGNITQGGTVGAINLNNLSATVMGNFEGLSAPEQWTRPVKFTNKVFIGLNTILIDGIGNYITSPSNQLSIYTTSTPLAISALTATSTYSSYFTGNMGIGTTTPGSGFSVGSGTSTLLAGDLYVYQQANFRNIVSTSTAASGFGTSSPGLVLEVGGFGVVKGNWNIEATSTASSFIATSTLSVGTTSPATASAALSVQGSAYITQGLGVGVATTSSGGLFVKGSADIYDGLIVRGGKVGIGTAAPTVVLDVVGGISASTNITAPWINTTGSGAGKTVLSMTSNGASYGDIQVETVAGGGVWSLGYQASPSANIGTAVLTWNGTGQVGLSTTTPYGQLAIDSLAGTVDAKTPAFVVQDSGTSTPSIYVDGGYGRVGFGSSSPQAQVAIEVTEEPGNPANEGIPAFVISSRGTSTPFFTVVRNTSLAAGGGMFVGVGTSSPNGAFSVDTTDVNSAVPAILVRAGAMANIAIQVDAGDLCKDGSADPSACALNDLAELFRASDQMEAGDLAMIDPENPVRLKKATQDKRNLLAGAISTSPAIVFEGSGLKALGGVYKADENKVPLTLSGRIPVKVNLEGGEIHIGDPITVSSVPGVGKKATESGKVIGYAMQPYNSVDDIGKIIVLTNLENWLAPPEAGTATSTSPVIASSSEAISFVEKIWNALISKLTEWFQTALVFVKELTSDKITTQQLCVGSTCVNEAQLQALLQGNPSTNSGSGSTSSPTNNLVPDQSGGTTLDTDAPVIQLNGLNPTEIEKGSVYSDLGATVTDNVSQNLGYKVIVRSSADLGSSDDPNIDAAIYPNELILDTSTPIEYTITYIATDQAGNTGTTTRTVRVVDPYAPASQPTTNDTQPTTEPSTEPAPTSEPGSESSAGSPEANDSTPAELLLPGEPTPAPEPAPNP